MLITLKVLYVFVLFFFMMGMVDLGLYLMNTPDNFLFMIGGSLVIICVGTALLTVRKVFRFIDDLFL